MIAALAFAGALSGCVFDGFGLPNDVQLNQAGATEPVASLSTYRFAGNADKSASGYSRFVRVDANRYAWELLIEKDREATYQALEASFLPLEAGWHVLHWRNAAGDVQGIHLVRFDRDHMLVAEVSKAQAAISQRVAPQLGVKVTKQFGGTGLVLDEVAADRLLPFLRSVVRLPGLSAQRHERVDAVPAALRQSSLAGMAELFSAIDLREVGEPARAARMLNYFRVLHGEGVGPGSYAYARFAGNGWGMAADPKLARQLANVAITRGVLRAHTVLGFLSQAGSGGPVDHGAALRHFELAAKADDGRAYYGLGLAYLQGHGVEKNSARAAEWFEKGAKQGVPLARVALAELLLEGNGIAKDDGRAVELLDQAVAALHPSAYQVRAWMHEQGRGGAKDAVAASRLYLLAAQAGLPFSQWQIGERLFAGTGIAQDRKAGRQWVEKAAAAGLAGAKERLAKLDQPAGGSDPWNAYVDSMTGYLDGRIKDLSGQADAARRRIDQLNRDQHKNVLDLRKLLANELDLVRVLLQRVDNRQQMVAKIDELLALGSVAADELAQWQSKRSGALDQQVAERRRIADLMGKYPHALAWRLPDGRIVVARPDGHRVALGSDPPANGIDTAALPRKGDQWVSGANVNALGRYEESWTGVPNEDARVVRLVASLNELMGRYSCDRSVFGSSNVSSRNTGKAEPPVVVDVNRVLRLREQGGDSKQDLWFEREAFIPLGKVGEVELQRTRAGATCATVILRCDRTRQQCVAVSGSDPEVSISVAVSLSFTDDAKATRAAQLLEELIRLPR